MNSAVEKFDAVASTLKEALESHEKVLNIIAKKLRSDDSEEKKVRKERPRECPMCLMS